MPGSRPGSRRPAPTGCNCCAFHCSPVGKMQNQATSRIPAVQPRRGRASLLLPSSRPGPHLQRRGTLRAAPRLSPPWQRCLSKVLAQHGPPGSQQSAAWWSWACYLVTCRASARVPLGEHDRAPGSLQDASAGWGLGAGEWFVRAAFQGRCPGKRPGIEEEYIPGLAHERCIPGDSVFPAEHGKRFPLASRQRRTPAAQQRGAPAVPGTTL